MSIDSLFNDLVFFEGNANSLRIALCPNSMFDGRRINPTRTTLSALVKYPWDSSNENAAKGKKYNFFQSDMERVRQLVNKGPDTPRLDCGVRHPLSFLLEAADDISYVTSDFEDAFRAECFTLQQAICFMREFIVESQHNTQKKSRAYALVDLLAIIAGDNNTIVEMQRFSAEYYNKKGYKNMVSRPSRYKEKDGGLDFSSYYVYPDGREALNYLGTPDRPSHTFSSAVEECDCLDATQLRQLQETYVSRWVDVVRRWLCFATAKEFVKNPPAGAYESRGEATFGDHELTVGMLKGVMRHFVYGSAGNLQKNLLAESIIDGLLDRFVPAVIRCQNPIFCQSQGEAWAKTSCFLDQGDRADGLTDGSVRSGALSYNPDLISQIPLQYRLDYIKRKEEYEKAHNGEAWGRDRGAYERIMMLMDFISSMTDAAAKSLYETIL